MQRYSSGAVLSWDKINYFWMDTIPRKATPCDFSLAMNINSCVAQAWNSLLFRSFAPCSGRSLLTEKNAIYGLPRYNWRFAEGYKGSLIFSSIFSNPNRQIVFSGELQTVTSNILDQLHDFVIFFFVSVHRFKNSPYTIPTQERGNEGKPRSQVHRIPWTTEPVNGYIFSLNYGKIADLTFSNKKGHESPPVLTGSIAFVALILYFNL